MNETQLLVIGDIHGCFHTFRLLVQQHWRPNEEVLVHVGDLIDRGNFSPQCVGLARTLSTRFPNGAIFLKGNHEFEVAYFLETRTNSRWLDQGGSETLVQYKDAKRSLEDDVTWMKQLPLCYETSSVLVTHGGITDTPDPYRETNPRGVLWNRMPLTNIGRLQIIGHTPLPGKPEYREVENAWNIDTGAYTGNFLSALRVSTDGRVQDVICIPTVTEDYVVASD